VQCRCCSICYVWVHGEAPSSLLIT
jgi:hypothetical protein